MKSPRLDNQTRRMLRTLLPWAIVALLLAFHTGLFASSLTH